MLGYKEDLPQSDLTQPVDLFVNRSLDKRPAFGCIKLYGNCEQSLSMAHDGRRRLAMYVSALSTLK